MSISPATQATAWRQLLEAASRRARRRETGVLCAMDLKVAALDRPTFNELDFIGASNQHPVAWWKTPDTALAGIGEACVLSSRGPGHIRDLSAKLDEALSEAIAPGCAVVAFTALGFAEHTREEWSAFAPARAWIPKLTLTMQEEESRLTIAEIIGPQDSIDTSPAALAPQRAINLVANASRSGSAPNRGNVRLSGTFNCTDAQWEEQVQTALDAIGAGTVEKLVLARRLSLRFKEPVSALDVATALRSAYPHCYSYGAFFDNASFVGSSPELLISKKGLSVVSAPTAATVAAGHSRAEAKRLAKDLAGEKQLREHNLVVDSVRAGLSKWCNELKARPHTVLPAGPVQHLVTRLEGRLRSQVGPMEIAADLQPTPAVSGSPKDVAMGLLAEYENFSRGWYAGSFGTVDSFGDGSLAVALRCALIQQTTAHLYAGAGIVDGSKPDLEREEIDLKIQAVASLLPGEPSERHRRHLS